MTTGKAVAVGAVGLVLGVPAVLLLIVGALILGGVTHVYAVPGGQHVFSVRYLYTHPGRSHLVAFHVPAEAPAACRTRHVSVERIVGLPGETWQEQHGRVYIDHLLLRETYLRPGDRDDRTYKPVQIPAGSYFVLADDRHDLCDSRTWGPIPGSAIIGRVIATYWPPSRIALH